MLVGSTTCLCYCEFVDDYLDKTKKNLEDKMRLPYDYVSNQVDLLYEKKIDTSSEQAINDHCLFIQDFIKSCGWDLDDFIRCTMGYSSNYQVN